MSVGAVAERYAQALFELGVAGGSLPVLAEKLRQFAQVYTASPELRLALENPTLTEEQREAILVEVARRVGVPDVGTKALRLMARRRKLPALSALAERLLALADEKGGVVRASITTAQKMPESYYQTLSSRIAAATQRKVILERQEDPSLLGGAIAKIGDAIIDGSLKGRLDGLERQLFQAFSTESAAE